MNMYRMMKKTFSELLFYKFWSFATAVVTVFIASDN